MDPQDQFGHEGLKKNSTSPTPGFELGPSSPIGIGHYSMLFDHILELVVLWFDCIVLLSIFVITHAKKSGSRQTFTAP